MYDYFVFEVLWSEHVRGFLRTTNTTDSLTVLHIKQHERNRKIYLSVKSWIKTSILNYEKRKFSQDV